MTVRTFCLFASVVWAIVATISWFASRAANRRYEKRIQENFERSIRRIKAGMTPLTIEEIYEV